MHLIFGETGLGLSGVNSYNSNLALGFKDLSHKVTILQTGSSPHSIFKSAEIPTIHLEVKGLPTWHARWRCLRTYLESQAPCFYFPNHDKEYSSASPTLGDNVFVVGVAHGDDPYHYEHLGRLGDFWNATVCVSNEIAAEARGRFPHLREKIVAIPNAVPVPDIVNRTDSQELRLVYAGRLEQDPKQVFDLVLIVEQLYAAAVPFRMSVIGDGGDEQELKSRMKGVDPEQRVLFTGSLPNIEVLRRLEEHDIVVLTSKFEGLPMILLEGMARGCVPVVTKTRSGITDLVEEGQTGFLFNVGDCAGAAISIRYLNDNRFVLNQVSLAARNKILHGPFNRSVQLKRYLELFDRISGGDPALRRQRGRPCPPDFIDASPLTELKSRVRQWVKLGLGLESR